MTILFGTMNRRLTAHLWTPAHSGVVAKRGQKVELLIPRELLVSENTLEVLLDHGTAACGVGALQTQNFAIIDKHVVVASQTGFTVKAAALELETTLTRPPAPGHDSGQEQGWVK